MTNYCSSYQAVALGVNTITNNWNEKIFYLPMNVEYVSIAFTFLIHLAHQLTSFITGYYGYDRRFAWAESTAAFFHLLGASFAYIVSKDNLHAHSSFIALHLLALSAYSRITFEQNAKVQTVLLCQLLVYVFRLSIRIPQYHLLLDGLALPLSLVSTGDARIKFKVSEEDAHLLKLEPNSWFQVREDYADHVKFEGDVSQEVILSVSRKLENIVNFTMRDYQADVIKFKED